MHWPWLFPQILGDSQQYIKGQIGAKGDKPVFFVFHGGSGSSREEIREAISYGVVKMNIDTDTQVGAFGWVVALQLFCAFGWGS